MTPGSSRKDVGASDNEIESYTILDAGSNDVTANFTGVTTVKGKLTVNPKEAIISTGSASKAYDGQPLTNAEASHLCSSAPALFRARLLR